MQDYYGSKITLENLAEMVHFNPVYFSILFKKETGTNFKDYLAQYRTDVAKNLLRDGAFSISDVSLNVGYEDVRSFSKLFRKKVGLCPSEYKALYS